MDEYTRDRAFTRNVYIDSKDRNRFDEFLLTIPRHKIITNIKIEGRSIIVYTLKLKKQELLYIELAFNAVIKKPKARKKKTVTPTGTKKSV